jgi:hypothetical protein
MTTMSKVVPACAKLWYSFCAESTSRFADKIALMIIF